MSYKTENLKPGEFHPDAKRLAERDYSFVVTSGEDCVEITFPDLPGCVTYGDTIEEALGMIEEAKLVWISTLLKMARSVPSPKRERDFSGRFLVRATPDLHHRLAQLAVSSKMSLNRYVVKALNEYVGLAEFRRTVAPTSETSESIKWAFQQREEPVSECSIDELDQVA